MKYKRLQENASFIEKYWYNYSGFVWNCPSRIQAWSHTVSRHVQLKVTKCIIGICQDIHLEGRVVDWQKWTRTANLNSLSKDPSSSGAISDNRSAVQQDDRYSSFPIVCRWGLTTNFRWGHLAEEGQCGTIQSPCLLALSDCPAICKKSQRFRTNISLVFCIIEWIKNGWHIDFLKHALARSRTMDVKLAHNRVLTIT